MQRSTVIPRRLSTSGALATGLVSGILVCSLAIPAAAQVVAQGAPAATTDAAAWPIKVLFGGAQIDPRDISDRLARQVGRMVLVNSTNTEIGTLANPVRVDPTGTTTQPVSGTVLATTTPARLSASGTITGASQSVSISPLVDGSVVSINLTGVFVATLNAQVSNDGVTWTTAGIIYDVSNPADAGGTPLEGTDINKPLVASVQGAAFFRLFSSSYTSGTATITLELNRAAAFPWVRQGIGSSQALVTPWWVQIGDGAGISAHVKAASTAAVASDPSLVVTPSPNGSAILMGRVGAERTTTTAVGSVVASVTNVTCLASNTGRVHASVYNDSTADLFLKLGATASATSFTAKIFADGYFRLPAGYTGIVDCIWSSATGNARTTEATP